MQINFFPCEVRYDLTDIPKFGSTGGNPLPLIQQTPVIWDTLANVSDYWEVCSKAHCIQSKNYLTEIGNGTYKKIGVKLLGKTTRKSGYLGLVSCLWFPRLESKSQQTVEFLPLIEIWFELWCSKVQSVFKPDWIGIGSVLFWYYCLKEGSPFIVFNLGQSKRVTFPKSRSLVFIHFTGI